MPSGDQLDDRKQTEFSKDDPEHFRRLFSAGHADDTGGGRMFGVRNDHHQD